jgi:hypothetical protein
MNYLSIELQDVCYLRNNYTHPQYAFLSFLIPDRIIRGAIFNLFFFPFTGSESSSSFNGSVNTAF